MFEIQLPPGYVPTAIPAPTETSAGLTGAQPAAPPPPPPREPLPYTYTLTATDAVLRSDGVVVQNWPGPDREEYEFWLFKGGEPSPYVPVPTVPDRVTMRQARLALHQVGKLAMVEAAIDALPEQLRAEARIEWDHSQEVHRGRSFVQMLGPALGLTSQQLDELFILAGTL